MKDKHTDISSGKRSVFTVIMIALPLFFFLLAESILWMIGYGDLPALVRREIKYNKDKLIVNPAVTERYFNLPASVRPEPSEDVFDAIKRKDGVRILCLGGSTTAGFPYEINANFPFQLQYRLRESLLGKYVEVINLGISAINSYTVMDLMPEILDLQADMIVIYMGHNEFYGAFGSASSEGVSSSRIITRLYLRLNRFRTVKLVRSMIAWVLSRGRVFETSGSLMETLAEEQTIEYDSPMFRKTCENFEANLHDIIAAARETRTPVMISNLVSNVADQAPFRGDFSADLDSHTRQRLSARLLYARSLLESGNHADALESLGQLADADSSAADVSFYLGRAYLAAGDTIAAERALRKARDLDRLRFRAPAKFNAIIEEVARETDIPLIDMARFFRSASETGIPGSDLFLEHLHPNFDGYRLMAEAFLEGLKAVQFINPPKPISYQEPLFSAKQVGEVIERFPVDSCGVTALDLEFGNMRMFNLVHRWPFGDFKVNYDDFPPTYSPEIKKIARAHITGNLFWDAAHYQLASVYEAENRLGEALREYRSVYIAAVENYFPAMKMGDIYLKQQKMRQAENWYKLAYEKSQGNPNAAAKLGRTRALLNNFRQAVEPLTVALQGDSISVTFSNEERLVALYLLALSHANLSQWQQSASYLQRALLLDPGYQPAINLKNQIASHRTR